MNKEEEGLHSPDRPHQQVNNTLQVFSFSVFEIPLDQCAIADLNERVTRPQENISKLSERISRMGYEKTRAVWCIQKDGMYHIFAGGTRYEACKKLNMPSIPAIVYRDISDEEMLRLSHEDNVGDEYHYPVLISDVWAKYHHLNKDLGWTQDEISKAYDVPRAMVSYRINLHELPDKVKDFVSRNLITEAQLTEILPLSVDLHFHPWLTTDQIRMKCAEDLIRDCLPGMPKTVKASAKYVENWKAVIKEAETIYSNLKKTTLFDMEKDPPEPYEYDSKSEFVKRLGERHAYSLSEIRATGMELTTLISHNLRIYADYQRTQSTSIAKEAERLRKRQEVIDRVIHGDAKEIMETWNHGKIKLVITDPPYGMGYSAEGRRRKSKAPDVLAGDDQDAIKLTQDVLRECLPYLDEDAHVLVFCDWKHEPEARKAMEDIGLTIRGSLIWVKENHSAGDTTHTFAPQHERIIHGVKGSPILFHRLSDVFMIPRTHESEHPTEKPVELLKQLIGSCSAENEVILDPFGGSGSTLIAGMELHRDAYVVEIDQQYISMALSRLEGLFNEGSQ